MKREVLFFVIVGFVLMGVLFVGVGAEEGKVESGVYGNLTEKQEVEVYVKLKDSEGLFFGKDIEEAKEDLKKGIGEGKVKHETKKEIYANVTSEEIKDLERNDNVEKVEVEKIRELFLLDSVEIIGANDTWNLQISGINLTGAGQSVCVIDSGVDYRQESLGACSEEEFLSGNCSKVIGGWDFYNSDSNPMDDNGHGTHIAGIIAGNGNLSNNGIKGVAPDSKIIALKVCSSNGLCPDSAISKAIDYCIGNKTRWNVSAISLSLGSGAYESYCNDDSLADEINDAVANNISVVVASGNSGHSDRISSPACVEKAVSVGATDKSDEIASYSNRNSLLDLLAPGSLIVSAGLGDGNELATKTGTSMATPHVSAAFALMGQFLSLSGQNMSVSEIEENFKSGGKVIEDSNGQNYSRIEIYDSLNSVYNFSLSSNENLSGINVSLISPRNGSYINSNYTEFFCDLESYNGNLTEIGFELWNFVESGNESNLSLIYNESVDFSVYNVSNLSRTYNYTFLDEREYLWNCYASDSLGENKSSGNWTLFYDISLPVVELISPVNGSNFTLAVNGENKTIDFSYNVSDNYGINNCDLALNNVSVESLNGTDLVNETGEISYNLSAGNYTWNIGCHDLAGNLGVSGNWTLEVLNNESSVDESGDDSSSSDSSSSSSSSSSSGSGSSGGGGGGSSGGGSFVTGSVINSVDNVEENESVSEIFESPEVESDESESEVRRTRFGITGAAVLDGIKTNVGSIGIGIIVVFLIYLSYLMYRDHREKVVSE